MKSTFLILATMLLNSTMLSAQSFLKITGDPAVSDGRYSEGSSWGDIDNDGYLDVFVPHLYSEKENALFINNGDGSFTQVVSGSVVTDQGRSTGGSFGDFDNDGDLDLFVANYFGDDSFLYMNNGNGIFTKITTGAIVNDGGWSFGSSTADYDNDGFLDIFVSNIGPNDDGENNFLYKNNGNGTFTKITMGAIVNDGGVSASSSWCDYDNDGDSDLFVPNGGTFTPVNAENFLYQNNNDGTFTRLNTAAIGIDSSWAGYGSWTDYDNDGDFDLFVTNFGGDDNILYKNNGNGTFAKITGGIVGNDGGDSVSSSWGDFDNDGDSDIYVANDFNENNYLYENNGDGSFTKITIGDLVNDGGRSNGATWADYDNDGFLDLLVPNGQRPVAQNNNLYRNDGNNNNWINIKCTGTASNTTAIGTKVRAKALTDSVAIWQLKQISGSTGFNAQNSLNVEFGLGNAALIDSLVISWPSKQVDVYTNIDANQFYSAIEGTSLEQIVTSVQEPLSNPETFLLSQNYPNPFNPTTSIEYTIPASGKVGLRIFNLLGQEIRTLVNRIQTVGQKSATWDGQDNSGKPVASGLYIYHLRTAGKMIVKKMLLLR